MTPRDLRELASAYLDARHAARSRDDVFLFHETAELAALLERVEAATLERAAERVAQYPDIDERSAAYAARCIRALKRNDGKGEAGR